MNVVDIFVEATQEFLATTIVNVKRLQQRFFAPNLQPIGKIDGFASLSSELRGCSIVLRQAQHDSIG
jgi:hypothetical protein